MKAEIGKKLFSRKKPARLLKTFVPAMCISIMFFAGCSDLLMQLGENGSIFLEIQDSDGKTLALQADAAGGADADSEELKIEQGEQISVAVEVVSENLQEPEEAPDGSPGSETSDSDQYEYRWYLNGDRILHGDSSCTVNAERADIDSSALSPGLYRLKVLAALGPDYQEILTETVTFTVYRSDT